MRKAIHRGGTNNCYCDASRKVEIKDLEDRGAFMRMLTKDVPNGEVRIDGRFVYAIKNNPLNAGRKKLTHILISEEG